MTRHIRHIRHIISLFFLISSQVAFAQLDSDACHFWSDWSIYNPANVKPYYAGFLLTRIQQAGFEGQPISINADATFYKANWRSQFGGNLTWDYAGYTSLGKVDFKYAYSIGSDHDRVNLGLACGISFHDYDVSKVKTDNTLDEVAYRNEEGRITPNYNIGVEWVHKTQRRTSLGDELTLGASVLNLEDYLSRQEFRNTINAMYLYSSYRYRTMSHLDILGGLLFQYYDTNRLQSELHTSIIFTAADEGELDTYDKVVVGLSYRHNLQGYGNNDITINAGWGITKHLYLGYAFDFVVEDNIKKPFSTHEIFLQYRFINRKCVGGKFGGDSYKPLGGK